MADEKSLRSIISATENIGKMVASLQSEMIENQALQDVQNEQRVYAKVSEGTGEPSEHKSFTSVYRLKLPIKEICPIYNYINIELVFFLCYF